jgi:hypothetical protein
MTHMTDLLPVFSCRNAAAIQYLTIALRHSYAGAFAFANGNAGSMKELRDENSSGPSRVLKLGWAFFIIIALGSYTANLAAFLTGQSKIAETWQTMEDAATYGKVICTYSALRFEVKSAYPENVFRYEVDQKSILNAYDRGECDGYFGIMDEFYISQASWITVAPKVVGCELHLARVCSRKFSELLGEKGWRRTYLTMCAGPTCVPTRLCLRCHWACRLCSGLPTA